MAGSASQKPPEGHHPTGEATARYQELRELLTGPEQRQLADIKQRLDDPVRRAEELGQILPDAISLATQGDNRVARALQPAIDKALKASASKNPEVIADAIFPVLGPAIRKAISAALAGMMQSLNHMLNQSLSWQGLKWRLEALRTQKPFTEVVLLHTLIYRVEQIYLIHRRSGLLLYHVAAENIDSKDPDLISGMLTAIQAFVKDSFDTQTGEMLDTLRMDGDHSVWIEHGPSAILAAVIRGMPPVQLRSRFRELIDRTHRLYGATLDEFDGRTSSFAIIKPDLEDELTSQIRTKRHSSSPLLWFLAAAGLSLAAYLTYQRFESHRHWQDLVAQLRSERGIVLTLARKIGGRYYLAGLKDPLSKGVEEIISRSGVDPNLVEARWETFHALDETTVAQRAVAILNPPGTITLTLSNGSLKLSGRASHAWVKHFRSQVGTIPGILGYDDGELIDNEMNSLRTAISELEQQAIYFELGKSQIGEDQSAALSGALKSLQRIQQLNVPLGIPVRIAVVGQTDPSGPQIYNLQLSQQRAQAVLSYLIQNHVDPADMHAVGSAVLPPAGEKTAALNERKDFRSVTFKAFMGSE